MPGGSAGRCCPWTEASRMTANRRCLALSGHPARPHSGGAGRVRRHPQRQHGPGLCRAAWRQAAAWVAAQLTRGRIEEWRSSHGAPSRWSMATGCTRPARRRSWSTAITTCSRPTRWTSGSATPFTPTVRDGRLYGRGVSDDKGPMLIPLKVAQAYMAGEGKLPINIKFLLRGRGGDRLAQPGAVHRRTMRRCWLPTLRSRPTGPCGASTSRRSPSPAAA